MSVGGISGGMSMASMMPRTPQASPSPAPQATGGGSSPASGKADAIMAFIQLLTQAEQATWIQQQVAQGMLDPGSLVSRTA
jgi:hypothetical protein